MGGGAKDAKARRVQELFARVGCFFIERITPARDGALAFLRAVVRFRFAVAIGRQLIVWCRRRARSFTGGAHLRAIAVMPISSEKLLEGFADANPGFVQLGLRSPGSPTQYGSDFLVFITVNVMKEQGLSKALGQF